MSQDNQVNIEALLVKAFVYKYSPKFTPVQIPTTQVSSLATFKPFSIDLDDTQFYTKYDISDFIVGYSFDQDINETTYSWSLEVQDIALSYGTIDNKLKVKQPNGSVGASTNGLSFSTSTNSIAEISEYELNADNDTASNLNIVETAKNLRGKAPASLTIQDVNLTGVLSNTPGLRLSDLIQEYDFVSVYLYKNTTPLDQLVGAVIIQNGYPVFVPALSGRQLSSTDLQNETVLSSKMSNGLPLFSNEFNGFVMRKTFSSTINQVDRVILNGNGWTRLLGSTRRVTKPSLFQNSLYQQGQLSTLNDVSATQTVFAGRTISEIVRDLFDLTYRIDFQSTNNLITSVGPSTLALNGAYFNISSLLAANGNVFGPSNLFSLPQYLLAVVMKRRNFAYIEPTNIDSFISSLSSSSTQTTPEQFQSITSSASGQTLHYSGIQPVVVTSDVQNLQTYFQFLDEVYRSFSPDLKTPYEILNDIRTHTFIELFELSNGQFLIRSPQYNNTNIFDPTKPISDLNRQDINMVLSNSLNIITSTYSSQVENLISKMFTGYSANFAPDIPGMQQFAYCDGKLLDQFGLMESTTEANPNINDSKSTDSNVNKSQTNGLFEYVRYLLQIINGQLKTGTIMCDLDPTIQVGYTFFDQTKYKFGYIQHISKEVRIAGTATMSLGLSYVRDAVPSSALTEGTVGTGISNTTIIISSTNSTNVEVPLLPVVADIENAFNSGS